MRCRIFFVALTAVGVSAVGCTDPERIDDEGNTVEVTPDDPIIPPGVADNDLAEENTDADGYCFDPEAGYYPCDDGAPPGSGPPGSGLDGDDNEGDNGGDGDVDRGGGGNTPPGGGQPICDEETFQSGTAEPPRILLVVDKSGSMNDDAVGYPGSKWEGAVDAISAVVTSLDNDVEFGLMLFPDGDGNFNVCREGRVEVSVGPNRASRVTSTLEGTDPGGGTPTAVTLERAREELDALGDEGGTRVVVLATDGGPNCNLSLDDETCRCTNAGGCNGEPRNCLDDARTIAAAEALNNVGYSVFVIGIPGSENFVDVLNGLADAGGTALSGATRYYPASDADALAQSIESIANRVATCRFDLAGPVAAPSDVTVRFGQMQVPHDPTRSYGWDLVDADTIELFGAACDQVVGSPFGVTIGYCYTPQG